MISEMQEQISSWRKDLSIIAETGTGTGNGKLNRKSASKSPKNWKI